MLQTFATEWRSLQPASRFDAHLGNSSNKFDCMHWCTGSGVPEVILGILSKVLIHASSR